MQTFQQTQLLGRQAEIIAFFVESVESRKQAFVLIDRARMRRQTRRQLALDRLQRGRGLAR